MIGLSRNYIISCDKCSKGLDIGTAMSLHNHKYLNDIYECKCGNRFNYIEGIINDFCSELTFSQYEFISDIHEYGEVEIIIGKTTVVHTKSKSWIHNVNLNTGQDGVWLQAVIEGADRFKILSSECEKKVGYSNPHFRKIGDKFKVRWSIYGRSFKSPIVVWNKFLIKAKEQIINQEYLLSYFSAATALESFYNVQFHDILKKQGVHPDAIDVFLKESSFPDKIFKLSKSLLGMKYEKKTNKALERIIITRNKIAHGKTAEITREETQECFKSVASVIFKYILNNRLSD